MGDTRKVSAYPQLASYNLNIPLMKDSLNDERYKKWVKKSMTKRDEKAILEKVLSMHGKQYSIPLFCSNNTFCFGFHSSGARYIIRQSGSACM